MDDTIRQINHAPYVEFVEDMYFAAFMEGSDVWWLSAWSHDGKIWLTHGTVSSNPEAALAKAKDHFRKEQENREIDVAKKWCDDEITRHPERSFGLVFFTGDRYARLIDFPRNAEMLLRKYGNAVVAYKYADDDEWTDLEAEV